MSWWLSLLLCVGAALLVYAAFLVPLVIVGRRSEARALAGFIPDCLVLLRHVLHDDRVPRSRKLLVIALIGYLLLPFDLVPDFIPVAGQLDDVIIVVLVLRIVARSGGPALLREHWRGPTSSLNLILRLAYGRSSTPSPA